MDLSLIKNKPDLRIQINLMVLVIFWILHSGSSENIKKFVNIQKNFIININNFQSKLSLNYFHQIIRR